MTYISINKKMKKTRKTACVHYLKDKRELGVPEGYVALALGKSGNHITEGAQRPVDVLGLSVLFF